MFKERGNTHFKKQAFKEAIKQFSEAINLHESKGAPLDEETLKTAVSQCYTNRSLAFHSLNQQASALSDANYVITKIDASNAKALMRRAHAYKTMEKWEEAARDFQELYKENKNDTIKNDISFCLKKAIEAKKKPAAAPAPKPAAAPKVEEITPKQGEARSVKIEECSDDSDDEAEAAKKVQQKKKAGVDKETLEAAKAKAVEIEKKEALSQIPKTAAGFEKDFRSLKKDQSALQEYLKKMPCSSVEQWYKSQEVTYEVLSELLRAVEPVSNEEWVGKLLISLAKADNFEMTLMFAEDADRSNISKIISKLPGSVKASVQKKYDV